MLQGGQGGDILKLTRVVKSINLETRRELMLKALPTFIMLLLTLDAFAYRVNVDTWRKNIAEREWRDQKEDFWVEGCAEKSKEYTEEELSDMANNDLERESNNVCVNAGYGNVTIWRPFDSSDDEYYCYKSLVTCGNKPFYAE